MYRLEVKLKQHTPLIHFQWQQAGATLRASEVKPRLDRFILTKLGKTCTQEENNSGKYDLYDAEWITQLCRWTEEAKNWNSQLPRLQRKEWDQLDEYGRGCLIAAMKNWFIGEGAHPALDYKMNIIPESYIVEGSTIRLAGKDQHFDNQCLELELKGKNAEYNYSNESRMYYITAQLYNNAEDEKNDKRYDEIISKGIRCLDGTPFFAQEEQKVKLITGSGANFKFQSGVWEKLEKKGILYPGWINLTCRSFYQDINHLLEVYIREFFACTNFGTRQSKGFGGFMVLAKADESGVYNTWTLTDLEKVWKANFAFAYSKEVKNTQRTFFQTIQKDYRLLKSGRAKLGGETYAKAKMFRYGLRMKEKYRWEKRFIKRAVHNVVPLKADHAPWYDDSKAVWEDVPEPNYIYLRAVLGLAEQYEFLVNSEDKKEKLIIEIDSCNKSIQRIASPLLFKVIGQTIYLLGNDIPDEIKGKGFCFSYYLKSRGKKSARKVRIFQNKKAIEELVIPKDFSLPEFIEYALNDALCTRKYNYSNARQAGRSDVSKEKIQYENDDAPLGYTKIFNKK
ncbi:hypothetical protein [Culturomica massiliensis]|uniref:hypothetical protein n=1 Tax=Culturomica massiliensis TaxID=1841857 RepID=UPI000839A92C|nr:hypothetical protein [Culturomica massiliensis]